MVLLTPWFCCFRPQVTAIHWLLPARQLRILHAPHVGWALFAAVPLLLSSLDLGGRGPRRGAGLERMRASAARALAAVGASETVQQPIWAPLAAQLAAALASAPQPSLPPLASAGEAASSESGAPPTRALLTPLKLPPRRADGGVAAGGSEYSAGGISWPAASLSSWLHAIAASERTRGVLHWEREQLLSHLSSAGGRGILRGGGHGRAAARAQLCARLVHLARAHAASPEEAPACAAALSMLSALVNAETPRGSGAPVLAALEASDAIALCIELVASTTSAPPLLERAATLACDLLEREWPTVGSGHAQAMRALLAPSSSARSLFAHAHARLAEACEILRTEAADAPAASVHAAVGLNASAGGARSMYGSYTRTVVTAVRAATGGVVSWDDGGGFEDGGPEGVLRAAGATLALLATLCRSPDPAQMQSLMHKQSATAGSYNLVIDAASLLPPLVPLAASGRATLVSATLGALEAMVAGAHVDNQWLLVRRRIPHACSALLTLPDRAPNAASGAIAAGDDDAPRLRRGALSLLAALAEGAPSLRIELAHAVDFRSLRRRVTLEYEAFVHERARRSAELRGTVMRVLKRDSARAAVAALATADATGRPASATGVSAEELMTARSEETYRTELMRETDAQIAALQPTSGDDAKLREAFRAYTLLTLLAGAAPERAAAAAQPEAPTRATSTYATYASGGDGDDANIFSASEVAEMPWLRAVNDLAPPPGGPAPARPSAAEQYAATAASNAAFASAAAFFEKQLLAVDVRWPRGPTHHIVFPVPMVAQYLPPSYGARLNAGVCSHGSLTRSRLEITMRADSTAAITRHREWIATATLPALLAFLAPPVRLGLLINCGVLNLLAATSMDYDTRDGRPHLWGASLLLPVLALVQLIGAAAILVADVVEFAPPAIEERWCARRVRAAMRERGHLPPHARSMSSDALAAAPQLSAVALAPPPMDALANDGSAVGGGGNSALAWLTSDRRFVPPAWLANCANALMQRCWPVRALSHAIGASDGLVSLLRDGRVRPADGFPDENPLAVACRAAAGAALAATEPQLFFGVVIIFSSVPALLAQASAPIVLALQLLLLVASRSDGARHAATALLTPWPQLIAISLLGLGLLFMHAAVSYYLFGEALSGIACADDAGLGGCVAASMVGGSFMPYGRAGIDGDAAEADETTGRSVPRLLLDVSCYLSVGVLTLGALLATMLEAFDTSRKAAAGATFELDARCAVSGLTREAAATRGERSAQRYEPYAYVLYLLHLRGKRQAGEALTALEASVERRAAMLDLSWFPRAAEGLVGDATDGVNTGVSAGKVETVEKEPSELGRAMRRLMGLE